MKKLFLFLVLISGLFAASQKAFVQKEVCVTVSDYPGKTVAQIKDILINKAKESALTELYGQLLYTREDLKNGKLLSEEVRNRAVGIVRIQGSPQFFNGKNLGEICVRLTAYATKKDLQMYSPKKVSLKHFCYTNPDVPIKEIKQQAKYAAFKEIVSEYNPKLKITGEEAENYIHQFQTSNAKFDFNTMSYCFDATATILPYELQLAPNKLKYSKKNANKITKKSKKLNVNYPAYFDNYVWEGEFKTKYHQGKLITFFLNKEKTLLMIITIYYGDSKNNKPCIFSTILKGKITGLKMFYKRIVDQQISRNSWSWSKLSGIVINNQFKGMGTFYGDGIDINLALTKTKTKVKDYFSEIWIGKYDTTKFNNGKIVLLRNKEIVNYWADLYPTKNERGTETFKKNEQNGVLTFSYISGYDPIKGYDYDSFSFTGSMISPNKFIGAGTGNFVTKIELTRVK